MRESISFESPAPGQSVLLVGSRPGLLTMVANVLRVRGVVTDIAADGCAVGRRLHDGLYGAVVVDRNDDGDVSMDPHFYGYRGPVVVLLKRKPNAEGVRDGDEVILMPANLQTLVEKVLELLADG